MPVILAKDVNMLETNYYKQTISYDESFNHIWR